MHLPVHLCSGALKNQEMIQFNSKHSNVDLNIMKSHSQRNRTVNIGKSVVAQV